jgi:phage portal protein BeeE
MLAESLRKAFDRADAMVALARSQVHAKAAGGSIMDAITSNPGGSTQRANYSQAREQYAACKGWVWAAVRLKATRIAGQPIHVAKDTKRPISKGMLKGLGNTDGLEPLEQHPILDLLADPNELMTSWSLMYSTVFSLELTGRSLWWVTQDGGRQIILPIPSTWIQDVDAKRTVWQIQPTGSPTSIPVPGDEIVHFYYPDPADPFGCISPLQQIATAVEADNAIGECQYQAFVRGILPRVALTVGKKAGFGGAPDARPSLTPMQRKQIVEAIKAAYQSWTRFEEPIILDGLIENVIKLSNSPNEFDWLDSSKVVKSRILQAYGVSPILLGEVEGANRASATVADEIFVANGVNPLCHLMSLTLTEWLPPMFGEQLRVWIEPAVPRDEDMKLKRWQAGATLGNVTPNEFRRAVLNLPDIEGGDSLPDAGKPTPVTTPTAPDAAKPDTAVNTQQQIQVAPELTLNGAQIAAASAIVQSVADEKISRDSGIGQLMVLLNLTEEQAERVMGSVGEGFVAATPTEKATELERLLDPLTNPYTLERLDGNGPPAKTLVKATRSRRKGPGK